jgi:glycosyltransferase involved in cell wall biosynthesis
LIQTLQTIQPEMTMEAGPAANEISEALRAGAQPLAGRKVLIVVENLPVPFDRRVWQEARALRDAGAKVSIICPVGVGHEARYEEIGGIHIYRHPLPRDAEGALGYLLEYGSALFWETLLAWRILFRHGFDSIHACNPPDLIFLVALPFKLLGKRFLFDHHDINPELYEAKFGKRGLFWRLMVWLEWLTFKSASVVISTNDSYRRIAIERGGKRPEDVFVVRSGPDLSRVKAVPPNPALRKGRKFLVGYVGVIGDQEGIDLLLESVSHTVYELGRTDIQFCLVGGGPSLDKLKSAAERMRISDYVTFTGRAPDALLFEVLSTADVCVNPDRVNPMNDKSTMNKILEYMALGKPIVQFDVTEGRYSAGEASLYAHANDPVDFAEKVLALVDDPDARARMGKSGRERVETQMAWSYEIPKLIAAYKRLLSLS